MGDSWEATKIIFNRNESHSGEEVVYKFAAACVISDCESQDEELLAAGWEMDHCERPESVVERLPEYVLIEIFSYLPLADFCRCAQVCEKWNRIIKNQRYLKVIDISDFSPTYEQFIGLVNIYCTPALVDFRMTSLKCDHSLYSYVYSRAVVELATKCPSLKKLTLKRYFDFNSTEVVVWMGVTMTRSHLLSVKNLPKTLVHLCLRGALISPYSFFGRAPQQHLPHLKCLDVGEVNNITSGDIRVFSHCKNLKAIYLDGCGRINNGGLELIEDILPQLCVLDLEGTDINNSGVTFILEKCVNIKELLIGQTDVTSEAFFALKGNMAFHLKKLCIRNTYVSSHAIHYFITQCFAGKKVLLITSWLEIVPKCLTRHNNCCIVNHDPELILSEQQPCCHFKEHTCEKF